ncbi:MAG: hypothetical protein JWQ09_4286 [Segetibacter sp.]|nr:hypothetical protein [Segetibacter sp.]
MAGGWHPDQTTTAGITITGLPAMEEMMTADMITTRGRLMWLEMTKIEMTATVTTTMEEQMITMEESTTTKDQMKMIKEVMATAGIVAEDGINLMC